MQQHSIFVMCGFEQTSFEFKFHLKMSFENLFEKYIGIFFFSLYLA